MYSDRFDVTIKPATQQTASLRLGWTVSGMVLPALALN